MKTLGECRWVTLLPRMTVGIGMAILLPMFLLPAISPAAGAVPGTLVDSQGFEGYSLGKLQDQYNWLWTGSTLDTATVESTVVYSGSQAVALYRGGQSDTRWAVPVSVSPTSQQLIDINWDMKVLPSNCPMYGPFFGVEAYDRNLPGGPGLFGSVGVDAATGDVLYQAQGTGYLTETGGTVGNTWNQFRLLLNFGTQQYSAYLNGSLLTTQGFVDGSRGLTTFTDADLSAFAAAADSISQAATGTAYFDNFTVQLETHGVWNAPQSGSWSVGGNWQDGQVPVGGAVMFSSSSSYWPVFVTLDGNQKAGSMTFFVSGTNGYTVAQGSGGILTLDNSGSLATISVTGTNVISAPLSLASSLSVSATSKGQLQISGNIGEAAPGQSLLLTGDGTGTLILSGSNSYTGGTTVSMGTLVLEDSQALPSGTSLTVDAGGTLIYDPAYGYGTTKGAASVVAVPEPGSLVLLAAGGLLFSLILLRKKPSVVRRGDG